MGFTPRQDRDTYKRLAKSCKHSGIVPRLALTTTISAVSVKPPSPAVVTASTGTTHGGNKMSGKFPLPTTTLGFFPRQDRDTYAEEVGQERRTFELVSSTKTREYCVFTLPAM